MTYRSLNHDDDNGGPTDDHWRKKSKITHDSSNTGGGGDLADYLQNLVDGMERGRAQTLHQNSSPQQSRQGKDAGNGLKQQQRRSTVAAAAAYSGADQSLLTLVGPSSSTGGTMSPLNREQAYDERQVSAHRWASAVRIGPAVYDGDGNELPGEKIAGIERWREHVARETALTYTATQGNTASENNGPSSTASLVSRSDELSPSSFVMPNTLVGREQDNGLYNDGEDEDDDDFGNNDNDGGRSARSSV
jgi:hypothetical protein